MFAIKKIATIAAAKSRHHKTAPSKVIGKKVLENFASYARCVWFIPPGWVADTQKPPRLYCLFSDGIALYQGVRRVSLMFACRDLGWCRLAMSPLVLYPLAGLLRFCKKIQCSFQSCFQTCPWLCKAYIWGAGCWLLELLWAEVMLVCLQKGKMATRTSIFSKPSKSVKRKNCFLSSRRRASPDGANHL